MRLSLLPALVGACLSVSSVVSARAAEMTFSTVRYTSDPACITDCSRLMVAYGAITRDTPKAFLDFARREITRPGLINVLLIHSPGGSVKASLELGKAFRKLGTVLVVARSMEGQAAVQPPVRQARHEPGDNLRFVSGTCASACVYALAGGAKRVVPPESRIAVHRMAGNVSSFDFATRDYQTQKIYAGDDEVAALASYIQSMGVSPDLIELAESIPHEHARVLTNKEISRYKLAAPRL